MLLGLQYLHFCDVIHRDIKADNILISHDGIVKMADFGSSKNAIVEQITNSNHKQITGTPMWMSILYGLYGKASDVWSLGCTIIEMLTGDLPYPHLATAGGPYSILYRIANERLVPNIPNFLGDDAKSFLQMCLKPDPADRATVDELLNHPFIVAPVNPNTLLKVSAPIFNDEHEKYEDENSFLSYDGSDHFGSYPNSYNEEPLAGSPIHSPKSPFNPFKFDVAGRRGSALEAGTRSKEVFSPRRPSLGMILGSVRAWDIAKNNK
ncbi:MAPKKK protein [Acrasis kona]|uniref:MAPKKK protein n=1 Tax=Acrasis kona TaxID=1008807 RepID=A0AAW2ZP79_9EUKA